MPQQQQQRLRLLNEEPAIISFIIELTGGTEPMLYLKQRMAERNTQLFQLIEHSKARENYSHVEGMKEVMSVASANAATVLNSAQVNFSMKDLSGVSLRGANLEHAIMSWTNLEGADLRETKLNCAWLQGANLKDCDMRGATFGELAYKTFDSAVRSCAYSPNGKLFAVARNDCKDVLLLHVSASRTLGDVVQTLVSLKSKLISLVYQAKNNDILRFHGKCETLRHMPRV